MSEQKVIVEQRGNVLVMALNRPAKYNAFDPETYFQLADAYGRLDREHDLRCGLVYGNGNHFTAGLDLPLWTPAFAGGKWPGLNADQCDPFGVNNGKRVSKPIVFAAQGICFTVAIELMLAGDVRIAADNCRFGQIEVKRGIYACGGATLRMVQEFGWANAQRYLLTGDEFNSAEAHRIGLVQEVHPLGKHLERAHEMAEKIAKQAPLAVWASLKNSRILQQQAEAAAIAKMMPDLAPLMASEDVKEGVNSFVERREAKFQGK